MMISSSEINLQMSSFGGFSLALMSSMRWLDPAINKKMDVVKSVGIVENGAYLLRVTADLYLLIEAISPMAVIAASMCSSVLKGPMLILTVP